MNRYLLSTILCLWASCAGAYTNEFIGAVAAAGGASADYCPGGVGMTFAWHAETLDVTTGTPSGCSVGDTIPTAISIPALSTEWFSDGAKSISIPTGGDYYEFDISNGDIANKNSGTITFTFKTKSTAMAANAPIVSLYDTVSTNRIAISSASTPTEMKLRYVGNGTDTFAITSGANLQVDTEYDVVCKWNTGAATKLSITVNSVTGTSSSAINNMTNEPNKLWIGDSSSSMSGYKLDNLKIYGSWR